MTPRGGYKEKKTTEENEAYRGWLLQLLELVLPPSKARVKHQWKFDNIKNIKRGATFLAKRLDCIRADGPSALGEKN